MKRITLSGLSAVLLGLQGCMTSPAEGGNHLIARNTAGLESENGLSSTNGLSVITVGWSPPISSNVRCRQRA